MLLPCQNCISIPGYGRKRWAAASTLVGAPNLILYARSRERGSFLTVVRCLSVLVLEPVVDMPARALP